MERTEPGPDFEVYCYSCQTSFAAGTRNCIHCGNRIGKRQRAHAVGPEGRHVLAELVGLVAGVAGAAHPQP